MLTKEKLLAAFQLFDPDGSGEISIQEIIQVLGGGDSEEDIENWRRVVQEIDKDGNGEISFDEFVYMMQKLISDYKWPLVVNLYFIT